MVPKGENPNGVTFVNNNGVQKDEGFGRNRQWNCWDSTDGPRWVLPQPEYSPFMINPAPPMPVDPRKRGSARKMNRTGE